MSEEQKHMNFPIEGATKCPACGSEERVLRQYFDELEVQGKAPKNSLKNGATIPIPILACLMGSLLPAKPEIPVVIISFDVCAKCNCLYSRGITLTKQPVQLPSGTRR